MTSRYLAKRYYKTDDRKAQIYNFLRLTIFPIDWFSSLLDGLEGTVLCLGCGYGILETILAAKHPELHFTASDLIEDRIKAAQSAVTTLPNITFAVIDATQLTPTQRYDHIVFMDLLHHLAADEQIKLLDRLWAVLKHGGMLVMKDVDTRPTWKYLWNYVHDSLMAGPPLTYYPAQFYRNYFHTIGGKVVFSQPQKFSSPYNHYALKVTKP